MPTADVTAVSGEGEEGGAATTSSDARADVNGVTSVIATDVTGAVGAACSAAAATEEDVAASPSVVEVTASADPRSPSVPPTTTGGTVELESSALTSSDFTTATAVSPPRTLRIPCPPTTTGKDGALVDVADTWLGVVAVCVDSV